MASAIPRITIVGSLNMDMVTVTSRVPKGGETIMAKSFSTGCGGKGANQAVATARLSRYESQTLLARVAMVGSVGGDGFGQQLRANLTEAGCDVSRVDALKDMSTGTATIIVEEETGENRILVAAGANDHLAHPSTNALSSDLVLAQLECPVETIYAYLEKAHSESIRVILNPSPATLVPKEVLNYVDYLVVNESEAALISGVNLKSPFDGDEQLHNAADAILANGATCVVITLGAEGVFYKVSGLSSEVNSRRFRAKPTKVVDSTGAGDTFVGAFAVRMARAILPRAVKTDNAAILISALDEAIRFGMDAAALTIQKKGAQDSIPRLADLPEWIEMTQNWT